MAPRARQRHQIVLQPKQLQLLDYMLAVGPEAPTIIGYGGARGGGKSGAIRRVALLVAEHYRGIKLLIVRRVYSDVAANHIEPMLAEFPHLREFYEATKKQISLPNGSVIAFGYAETAGDVKRKFRGLELHHIFVDQAEQFSEAELAEIRMAARWPAVAPSRTKLGLFFNPGGIGNAYLRRVFYLREYEGMEKPHEYAFIQAYGWDNYEWFRGQVEATQRNFYSDDWSDERRFRAFIEETSYGRSLNALPPSLRKGHLLGSFDSFEGQYFAGVLDENFIHLKADQQSMIRPWWNRWIAMDWGFAHFAAVIWFASGRLSPEEAQRWLGIRTNTQIEVVVAYRELVVNQTPEKELAQMIVDRSVADDNIQRFYLSPDAWAKKGSANTIAEQITEVMDASRMPRPEPADNDRVGGWRNIYDGLRQTIALRKGARVMPGPLLMIGPECPELASALPLLTRHPDKTEDVLKTDTKYDDVADCFRYGYKSWIDAPNKPIAERAEEVYDSYEDPTMKHIAMLRFKQKQVKMTQKGFYR